MRIYKDADDVIFEKQGTRYVLTSSPQEPCLYISRDGERVKVIRVAFDAYTLPEQLMDGGVVLGVDGRHYDEEDLCAALEAALEYEHFECDFPFAASLSRMEKKGPGDFITDGILAYGVDVGRFIFADENVTVYAVSDLPHISASDAFTLYQISPRDYEKLLKLSLTNRIPQPPVPDRIVHPCRKDFLCGESVYQPRYFFRLSDVDKSLTKKEPPQPDVMQFCPECGKKNRGDKFCRDCGTKLLKKVPQDKFQIRKITGSACKCRFFLTGGKLIEARAEFKGGKPGLADGQYVYTDSIRFADTDKKLTESELAALQRAYDVYAQHQTLDYDLFFIEGPEPRLLERGDYMGVRAFIYEYGDGTVVARTLCSECQIANSLADFRAMPREKLESMIYRNEMGVAR